MKSFVLYKQAREELKNSGLESRLEEYLEEAQEQEKQDLQRERYLGLPEARDRLDSLQEYIKEDVRPDNFSEHAHKVKFAMGQPQKRPWVIHAQPTYEVESDPSEVIMLEGVHTKNLFTEVKEDFWNHKKYGFANHHSLHGALTLRAEELRRRQPDATWSDENQETHLHSTGYLSIKQINITEHPVTAPTGAQVPFKPIRPEDKTTLELPYQQDLPLLVSALKYLEQTRTALPRATKNRLKKEIRNVELDEDDQRRIRKSYFNGREKDLPREPGFKNAHKLSDRDERRYELLATNDELVLYSNQARMRFTNEDVAELTNALIKHNLNTRGYEQATATRNILAYHHLIPY